MLEMLLLCTVDEALGRLDYDSLSDQMLMEMLIENMEEGLKGPFQDENGNYKDIIDWLGISCTEGRVTEIHIYHSHFNEVQFPFEFIPPLVTWFTFTNSNLHGTINPKSLPSHLTLFQVSLNNLTGSILLKDFPRGLKTLEAIKNQLSGSLILSDLPDALIGFDVSENLFSGGISFDRLPPALEYLHVDANRLTGSISISHLPESMKTMMLSENAFAGDVCLLGLDFGRTVLNVECNEWSGTLVLPGAATAMPLELHCDFITAVVDAEGNRHALEKDLLFDDW